MSCFLYREHSDLYAGASLAMKCFVEFLIFCNLLADLVSEFQRLLLDFLSQKLVLQRFRSLCLRVVKRVCKLLQVTCFVLRNENADLLSSVSIWTQQPEDALLERILQLEALEVRIKGIALSE